MGSSGNEGRASVVTLATRTAWEGQGPNCRLRSGSESPGRWRWRTRPGIRPESPGARGKGLRA